jgi:hypothetical protein
VDIYVAEQLARALQPSIANVNVKWNTNQRILHKVPEHAPPVFAGDRLLFYALLDETMPFDHATTVELSTSSQQQPIGLARIDHVPPVLDSQAITRLAAKALLRELTDVQKSTDKESLINLSIKYGILCPHTAFIGVEKRLNANSESNADMELREVPIMISHGSARNLQDIQWSINSAHSLMMANINCSLDSSSRMDSIDLLCARTACLSTSSRSFYKTASRRSTFSGSVGSVMQPVVGFFSSLFTKQKKEKHDTPTASVTATISPTQDNTHLSSYQSNSNNNQTSDVAWPTDEQKLVDRFIDLQQFDGLWTLTADDVKQLTGKSLTTFSSSVIENIEKNQQQSIITTAIVIGILETRCSSLKTLWQALSNKANKRLKELLGGDEIKLEQLIKDIQNQL